MGNEKCISDCRQPDFKRREISFIFREFNHNIVLQPYYQLKVVIMKKYLNFTTILTIW